MNYDKPRTPPPPLRLPMKPPASPASVVLTVVIWIAWVGVAFVADCLALLMFAFADSPGMAEIAQRMIVPIFVWIGVTFVAGLVLLFLKRPWQIVLAFALAISPPFLAFAGYNVLAGAHNGPAVDPLAPPPPVIPTPPGGFRPTLPLHDESEFPTTYYTTTTRESPTTKP